MLLHLVKSFACVLITIISIGFIRGDVVSYVSYGFNAAHFQLVWLLLPFALAAAVLSLLAELINRILIRGFGFNAYRMFASIGTPLHEISHAFLAVIFFHKIEKIVFFDTNPASGRLGYVIHSYNPTSLYQTAGNFFIGISPILAGVAVLTGFLWVSGDNADFLVVHSNLLSVTSFGSGIHFFEGILLLLRQTIAPMFVMSNLQNPFFWGYLFLLVGAGAHLSPSWSDIQGSLIGLVVFYGLIVIVNMLFLNLGQLLISSMDMVNIGFTFFVQAVVVQFLVVICLFLLVGAIKSIEKFKVAL